MGKNRSANIALFLVSCLYFLLFIPPNLTGAKDPNMLAAFRQELPEYGTDEFALFLLTMHMTSLEKSPYRTVHNLVFSNNFNYGYPFFLTSAMAIYPLRLLEQRWATGIPTNLYLVIVRALSALFMVLAINVLVYAWTEGKSAVKSVLLFVFLGLIPAVFFNNMAWHPDSLVTLFVVLTIFSLARDALRFGMWFIGAAVFCGLAIGTKVVGVFFFLAVAVYLVLGFAHKKLKFTGLIKCGVVFVAIMALSLVVSNPLLLLPGFAKTYATTLNDLAALNAWGWDSQKPHGVLPWYQDALRDNFGFWWIYAAALLLNILSTVYNPSKRLLNLMILGWTIPLSSYLLIFQGYKGTHYFIPVLLPALSSMGNLAAWEGFTWKARAVAPFTTFVVALTVGVVQCGYYLSRDVELYLKVLNREHTSSAIKFYHQLNDVYFAGLPPDVGLSIVREYRVYVPRSPRWEDHGSYSAIDYEFIQLTKPDLILLSKETVDSYADPSFLEKTAPSLRNDWLRKHPFFHDVKTDSLQGYRKLMETDFGFALVREKR
jgi:hypothetical protein